MIEDEKHSVWGALYEIDLMHMASLDAQEGVHIDKYIPLIKNVVRSDGEEVECRLYQMLDVSPRPIDYSNPSIPDEHKPSKSMYKFNYVLNTMFHLLQISINKILKHLPFAFLLNSVQRGICERRRRESTAGKIRRIFEKYCRQWP